MSLNDPPLELCRPRAGGLEEAHPLRCLLNGSVPPVGALHGAQQLTTGRQPALDRLADQFLRLLTVIERRLDLNELVRHGPWRHVACLSVRV
jgi:hypothetical protein